jgi:predicted HicB family RNase H-like nuclease
MAKKSGKGASGLKVGEIMAKVKSKKETKKNYTVRIDQKLGDEFQKYCKSHDVSMSEMVEEFFRRELNEYKA